MAEKDPADRAWNAANVLGAAALMAAATGWLVGLGGIVWGIVIAAREDGSGEAGGFVIGLSLMWLVLTSVLAAAAHAASRYIEFRVATDDELKRPPSNRSGR